ncbi:MAG: hypothetical protein ACLT8E_04030 [Akkermansia sp.]
MGNSFKYNEPVWDTITEAARLPVFRHLSAIITYSVCIPWEYKGHPPQSLVDNISSGWFLGYSPGFERAPAVINARECSRLRATSPTLRTCFWQQAGDLFAYGASRSVM